MCPVTPSLKNKQKLNKTGCHPILPLDFKRKKICSCFYFIFNFFGSYFNYNLIFTSFIKYVIKVPSSLHIAELTGLSSVDFLYLSAASGDC